MINLRAVFPTSDVTSTFWTSRTQARLQLEKEPENVAKAIPLLQKALILTFMNPNLSGERKDTETLLEQARRKPGYTNSPTLQEQHKAFENVLSALENTAANDQNTASLIKRYCNLSGIRIQDDLFIDEDNLRYRSNPLSILNRSDMKQKLGRSF